MNRFVIGIPLAAAAMLAAILLIAERPAQAQATTVRICHSTGSVNNPYETITVAITAADGNTTNDGPGQPDHFAEHTGDLFDPQNPPTPPISEEEEWGDIIPPIAGVHAGLNWTTAGQAVWNNNCNFPDGTPTPTPTVTATA